MERRIRKALVSVFDKEGVVALCRDLHAADIEILSSGGTAKLLREHGIPVTGVSEYTGSPELLDGRVKTLHPKIHAGILAIRSSADHMAQLEKARIDPIDLVVVNLYPFRRTAASGAPFDEVVEMIDVGGPTMVRAAAKNHADVTVVVDPADYRSIAQAVRSGGIVPPEERLRLAAKAFAHTSAYDADVHAFLAARAAGEAAAPALPGTLALELPKIADLRYGENPHQRAAWYAASGAAGLGAARVLQGKELSYTNLLDLDAAARVVLEFDEPAVAVIKHTNPCGVATGSSAADAYVRARDADALSAFGGIVGLNRPLDEDAAREITTTFIEAVIAPAVDPAALPLLAKKANMRVVVADFSAFRAGDAVLELRSVLGSLLVQERDRVDEAARDWAVAEATQAFRVVTRRAPSAEEWRALRFAWRVCAHVKSNTVLFAGPDRTLAVGAGQMSRVDAVKVAVMKAGAPLAGSVAASDAFFPFRDGLDAVAAAGATAVVQPGGSVRDLEVIAAADEHGLAMVFTGRRHFRH